MQLHQEFQDEAVELEQDIDGQLQGFHDFEGQRNRIEAFQERMQRRRTKLQELEKRLGVVRDQVADWERREGEWQAKITRRLRILWGAMTGLVLLVAALLAFQHWPARHNEHVLSLIPNNTLRVERAGGLEGIHAHGPAYLASLLTTSSMDSKSSHRKSLEQTDKQQPDSDPRLRLFDEL